MRKPREAKRNSRRLLWVEKEKKNLLRLTGEVRVGATSRSGRLEKRRGGDRVKQMMGQGD